MLTKTDIAIFKELLESNNKYLFSVLATKEDIKHEVNRLEKKIDNFKDEVHSMIKDLQLVNIHEDRIIKLEEKIGV